MMIEKTLDYGESRCWRQATEGYACNELTVDCILMTIVMGYEGMVVEPWGSLPKWVGVGVLFCFW